MVSEKLLHTKI